MAVAEQVGGAGIRGGIVGEHGAGTVGRVHVVSGSTGANVPGLIGPFNPKRLSSWTT
jgi:hypothetical protein